MKKKRKEKKKKEKFQKDTIINSVSYQTLLKESHIQIKNFILVFPNIYYISP